MRNGKKTKARMLIRRAVQGGISFLDRLLYQVAAVHGAIRPDLFRSGAKNYMDEELLLLIGYDERRCCKADAILI